MDVTRSCLECEDGASGLWMAPPVCFAAVFRSLVVGYGVMVVDADHADGAFRLASEVDHEHVVVEGVELEVVSVPERAALVRVVVPSALLHAPLGRQDRMMDANCSWVYFSLRGSAVRQKCGEALTLQFTGLPPVR